MADDPERVDTRRYTSSPSRSDREFHIAEGMGALRALVENTCRAIDRNSNVLENHIKDSQSDFRAFRDHFDLELDGVKKRIGDLESINERESAQKEQIGVWAKVLYTVFGGAVTTGVVWFVNWFHEVVAAARSIKPSYAAAFFGAIMLLEAFNAISAVDGYAAELYVGSSYSHSIPPYHLAPWSETPGGTVFPEGR